MIKTLSILTGLIMASVMAEGTVEKAEHAAVEAADKAKEVAVEAASEAKEVAEKAVDAVKGEMHHDSAAPATEAAPAPATDAMVAPKKAKKKARRHAGGKINRMAANKETSALNGDVAASAPVSTDCGCAVK